MSDFVSPYQFVPVTGQTNGQTRRDVDFAVIREGKHPFIRHDLWHRDGHSGRIVCRLHLETPTFVGNDQSSGNQSSDDETGNTGENGQRTATSVNHFQIDKRPAFPATSLRGMVGSILEALSQSALRVLDNIDYSVRQDASAGNGMRLGCITSDSKSGEIKIRKYNYLHVRTSVANTVFSTLPHPPVCYADFQQCRSKSSGRGPDELPDATAIANTPSATHTMEGFLLILDAPGNKLPPGRQFEIFAYVDKGADNTSLSVSPKAIERYRQLFAERWRKTAHKGNEPTQPFGFKGFKRDAEKKPCDLLSGQFVYFRATGNTVTEIRPSQIWRDKAGCSHDYFRDINPNVLPWGVAIRTGGLSPAEALLGVVERGKEDGAKGSQNLAGRVRFSAARHLNESEVRQLPKITLKILSSPKPPSPSMYFHPKGQRGDYLARSDLVKHASTPSGMMPHPPTPNGRKVYVHHCPSDIKVAEQIPWRSHNDSDSDSDKKHEVAPLDAGQDFFFHIDFDNLSHDELDLLLTALKPAPQHQHRLGLGKALGLGSVRLDIAAVCLRDTINRYTAEGLTQPRYRLAWREYTDESTDKDWQQRYAPEWQACENHGNLTSRPAEWRVTDNPLIDAATRELIALLGDPQQVRLPVLPPLLSRQMHSLAACEQKTYEWFVENDSTDRRRPPQSHQALGQLQVGEPLPGLDHDPPGVEN